MMASALLFGAVMALGFWLPYHTQFAIARTWARILFWALEHLCGLKYVVEGRERIPAGNHIVMSNHTSAWETVAQFVIFPAAGMGAEARIAVDTLHVAGGSNCCGRLQSTAAKGIAR
jgi:1-acyl-sn-glycerol-3-phosphate acyltransferase